MLFKEIRRIAEYARIVCLRIVAPIIACILFYILALQLLHHIYEQVVLVAEMLIKGGFSRLRLLAPLGDLFKRHDAVHFVNDRLRALSLYKRQGMKGLPPFIIT